MGKSAETKIGVLVELTRAFGRELCEGITSYAQEHEGLTPVFIDMKSLARPALLSGFDGFIARVMNDTIARRLAASGKPVVDVYYEKPRTGFAVVKTNHTRLGSLAAEHFIERKFSNFGFCGFSGGRFSEYSRQAFCRALSSKSHSCDCYEPSPSTRYEFDPSVLINERLNRAPDAKALTRWLKKARRPIAVFCPNDLRAWQLLQVCRDCGIDVPHEVAILGLDNDVLVCGFSKPMISSIDPNTPEIGRMAMRTVVEMIGDPALAKRQIVRQVLPAGVVERASTEVYPVDPPWLSDALVYIRKHIANRPTASEVYAHLGRSHTTVDAAFRKALGTTVQKTIAATRIEAARQMLRTSDLSIAQVAARCGFASQEYFSRSFAETVGTAPGSWRLAARTAFTGGGSSPRSRSRSCGAGV
ncbi:MAG: DNA-binding transcriptional regulator [Kiritimatiellae bacterium]|nr:DNA-binding transcriptional regulator [Kiritimatiellia bacterium]